MVHINANALLTAIYCQITLTQHNGHLHLQLSWSSMWPVSQDTYRYHGHSISDPGSSYRTRDEVQGVRRARDPIEHVRKMIVDHEIARSDELKKLERSIKKEVGSPHTYLVLPHKSCAVDWIGLSFCQC